MFIEYIYIYICMCVYIYIYILIDFAVSPMWMRTRNKRPGISTDDDV